MMKNGFKRVLSWALAVGVVSSTLCVPAQVFAADADGGFSDDFESYTAAERVTGKGTSVTNDVWKMSSVYCGWNDGGGSAVIADGDNKYLGLHGSGGKSWDAVVAGYTQDCSMLGPDVEMKIDYERKNSDSEGGIRFMVSGDEKSFYELYTGRYGGIFKLRKVTNGTEIWVENLTKFNVTADVWYSLSLANDGDTLIWSVTRKDNNETESGTIVDAEMFALRGGAAKYQVSITGDSNAYYDNFSLNNVETNAKNYVSQKLIVADSFESYDVMDSEQNSAVETVGTNWQSSSTYRGSGWNGNYMKSQLVDNGSKTLRLAGYGNSYPNETGCFNYIGDLSNVGSDVKMSVDMKAVGSLDWNNKGGIRFIAHNDDKNYYGLFSDGSKGGTYFEKVVNGEVIYSEKVSTSQTADGSYYTYTMEKRGNNIKYSVINKTTKKVMASGTYTDDAPFNPAKLNETYQLMVFNKGNFYFDNFRLTSSPEYYVNGKEPDNVLYRDIAAEALKEHNAEYKYESYTFDSPKAVRRIIAEGVTTEKPISVYLASAPDADWTGWVKLGDLNADADILNITSTQTESCVIFSNDEGDSDFTIDKVKILSDESEGVYTLKNEETVALYPRLGGVDCFDAWTVDDSNKVTAENGVFRAVGFGETTATAVNGSESVTVKLNANPPESNLYKEDFAEYTVMDTYLQGVYQTAGDWTTSGVYKGWNDAVKIQTVSAATNAMGFSGTNNIVGAIVHKLAQVQQDKPFIFKADLKSTHWANKSGAIRFCVSEDEKTYYELVINGMDSATPTFRKVVDETEVSASVDTASSTLGCNFSTTWLTLEMMLQGNAVTYSVTKPSDSTVLWEGIYIDSEPLAPTEKISMAGNGDHFIYADNIVAGSIDEFIDYQTEPQIIMYVDAAARRPVYSSNTAAGKLVDRDDTDVYSFDGNEVVVDMMGDYIIRKIKAAAAEGTIDLYVSNDSKVWYYLMPLTAEDGMIEALNTLTSNSYRYIKLVSADGKASEINVLAEPVNASVRLNSKLCLAAHIDGADLDAADVVWSSEDTAFLAVADGVVTPNAITTEPITVTATDFGTSASIKISVTDSCSFIDNGNGKYTVEVGSSYYKDGAKFVAVGYDADGIMTGVKTVDTGCVNTDIDAVSMTFDAAPSANKIKLFCWDGGMADMKPLCNAEEYIINQN